MCDPKKIGLKKALDTMAGDSVVVQQVDMGCTKDPRNGRGFGRGREQHDGGNYMCSMGMKACNKDSTNYSSILENKNAVCTT